MCCCCPCLRTGPVFRVSKGQDDIRSTPAHCVSCAQGQHQQSLCVDKRISPPHLAALTAWRQPHSDSPSLPSFGVSSTNIPPSSSPGGFSLRPCWYIVLVNLVNFRKFKFRALYGKEREEPSGARGRPGTSKPEQGLDKLALIRLDQQQRRSAKPLDGLMGRS